MIGGLFGKQIVESALLLRDRKHLRERKWAHRKMWRREKRFNVTTDQVPYMVETNGVIYAHPIIVRRIKEEVPSADLAKLGIKLI